MKSIFNAFYLSLCLYYLRKIFAKILMDIGTSIPRRSLDDSGCWNVVVRGVNVFYTYEKALAFEVARKIREEVPGLSAPHDIEVIEDESMPAKDVEEVPGLNSTECCELGLLINTYEMD